MGNAMTADPRLPPSKLAVSVSTGLLRAEQSEAGEVTTLEPTAERCCRGFASSTRLRPLRVWASGLEDHLLARHVVMVVRAGPNEIRDRHPPGLRDSACHGHQQPCAPGELYPSTDAVTGSPSPPCPSVQAIGRRVLGQNVGRRWSSTAPGSIALRPTTPGFLRLPGKTIESTSASPFSPAIPAPRNPAGRAIRRAPPLAAPGVLVPPRPAP